MKRLVLATALLGALLLPGNALAGIQSCIPGDEPHVISNPTITASANTVGTLGTVYMGNWDADTTGTKYIETQQRWDGSSWTNLGTVTLTWPTKTDYWTAITPLAGYSVRAKVQAQAHGCTSLAAYSNSWGPIALNSITYGINIDGVRKLNYTIAYPGCNGTATCANFDSAVESVVVGTACNRFNTWTASFSMFGGSQSNWPVGDAVHTGGAYPSWSFANNDYHPADGQYHGYNLLQTAGGTGCGTGYHFFSKTTYNIDPPLSAHIEAAQADFNTLSGTVYNPILWPLGYPNGQANWIEIGFTKSGGSCGTTPNTTYFYVETADHSITGGGGLICQNDGAYGSVAHARAWNGTYDNLYYWTYPQNSATHTYDLVFVSAT